MIDFSNVNRPKAHFAEVQSDIQQNSENEIVMLNANELIEYKNQPFKPYSKEKLAELVEDIKVNGILSPVIVRPMNGKYQILAGHNRTKAGVIAKLEKIPCIIKECSDTEAALILVNSNLNQRDELLPSERAFAYKIQKECMTTKQIAAANDESRKQVQRYLRLTNLNKFLLDKVDSGIIPFVSAINLSYLSALNQQLLFNFVNANEYKITPKISETLKEYAAEQFTDEFLFSIFEKKKGKRATNITFAVEELQPYFPDCVIEQLKEKVIDVLENAMTKEETITETKSAT